MFLDSALSIVDEAWEECPVSLGGDSEMAMYDATLEKKTFVLVHGAWHGGWCYERVANLLRQEGCRVYTPTLTGLGERSHVAAWPVNCSTHIEDVASLIRWERLSDVILCGHSYGGMVIGGVADRLPNEIGALVYLDAVVPEDGKSALDYASDPREILAFIAAAADGLWVPPPPARSFNVNPADEALVDALCTPQPLGTFCEKLSLKGAHMSIARKTYIRAAAWENPACQRWYDELRSAEGWRSLKLEGGHELMLDASDALVDCLLQA